MTQPLRDYQVDLIAQIEAAIAQGHRRIMLQLPTGAGKTRCFVELAKNHRFNPYAGGVHNCLIIAHRKELIDQAVEALKRELKNTPTIGIGIIKAGEKPYPNRSIQVASIQTLIRRDFPPAGFVIVDEAHHAPAETYQKILEHYDQAIILGVTATPIRRDGKGFEDRFDILIKGPSISELTAKQYLCPYRLFAYPIQKINLLDILVKAGDFDIDQLADAVATSEVRADLIETWEDYAKGKRTVIFAVNTKLSKEYTKAYCDTGYAAEHIDGKTPTDERDDILERFREGKTQILCNCSIVTEGFDLPELECVQVVRPTQSLSFWLQMVGRSLRTAKGKIAAIILDHTDNYKRLGLPDAERDWTLDGIDNELPELPVPQGGMGDSDRELVHREGELLEVYSNLINTEMTLEIPFYIAQNGGIQSVILSNRKEVLVTIPKGIKEGEKLKLNGQGTQGGDLHLIIYIQAPVIVKVTDNNFIENLEGRIKLEMIAIPGGNFLMGDNGLNNAKPLHSVSVKPFFMGKYPITQGQYKAVMGKNRACFEGTNYPEDRVNWNDAIEFCQQLSQRTGKNYRLPSEAEWEYACRAGTQTKYYFGDDEKQLENYAWYYGNSKNKIHPVGRKKPNQFGLYDMYGNVWEWCSDRWHENYQNAPTDGSSWETGTVDSLRVIRGGSWGSAAINCRSAYRDRSNAGNRFSFIGFRLVVS